MRPSLVVAACAAAALLLAAEPAHAQHGFGIRTGVSVDPDQFYFGAHVDAGPLVKSLWFRPNIEVGVGDDVTLIALNAELAYWFVEEQLASLRRWWTSPQHLRPR